MVVVLGYIVCADAAEAQKIGRVLVEEKLAACANVVSGVQSFFSWAGKIQNTEEAILFCKTLSEKIPAVEKKIKSMHTYDVPCICFYEAKSVNPAYKKWIRESLG